jgi:RNA 2',3'-cyclic 3'-phosphodiesterase
VSSGASLDRSERLRLFFGLPLPADDAEALARWATDALRGFAGVRFPPAEHLHATLAFLGGRPASELDVLRRALREACVGAGRPVLVPSRYRETPRVGMVVFGDEESRAARLQERLSHLLEQLDVYRPEKRPWLAHVTVARFRERPRARPRLPSLGLVSPSEAALYHSVLRPSGAQYEILESVALGG